MPRRHGRRIQKFRRVRLKSAKPANLILSKKAGIIPGMATHMAIKKPSSAQRFRRDLPPSNFKTVRKVNARGNKPVQRMLTRLKRREK